MTRSSPSADLVRASISDECSGSKLLHTWIVLVIVKQRLSAGVVGSVLRRLEKV
jgi:hypothetical protein